MVRISSANFFQNLEACLWAPWPFGGGLSSISATAASENVSSAPSTANQRPMVQTIQKALAKIALGCMVTTLVILLSAAAFAPTPVTIMNAHGYANMFNGPYSTLANRHSDGETAVGNKQRTASGRFLTDLPVIEVMRRAGCTAWLQSLAPHHIFQFALFYWFVFTATVLYLAVAWHHPVLVWRQAPTTLSQYSEAKKVYVGSDAASETTIRCRRNHTDEDESETEPCVADSDDDDVAMRLNSLSSISSSQDSVEDDIDDPVSRYRKNKKSHSTSSNTNMPAKGEDCAGSKHTAPTAANSSKAECSTSSSSLVPGVSSASLSAYANKTMSPVDLNRQICLCNVACNLIATMSYTFFLVRLLKMSTWRTSSYGNVPSLSTTRDLEYFGSYALYFMLFYLVFSLILSVVDERVVLTNHRIFMAERLAAMKVVRGAGVEQHVVVDQKPKSSDEFGVDDEFGVASAVCHVLALLGAKSGSKFFPQNLLHPSKFVTSSRTRSSSSFCNLASAASEFVTSFTWLNVYSVVLSSMILYLLRESFWSTTGPKSNNNIHNIHNNNIHHRAPPSGFDSPIWHEWCALVLLCVFVATHLVFKQSLVPCEFTSACTTVMRS